MSDYENSNEIEADAQHWVWRLDRDGRTPELTAALDAWLAGDSRRQGAFLQAEALWLMLDAGRRLPGEDIAVEQPAEVSAEPGDIGQRAIFTRRTLMTGAAALAAGVAGLAAIKLMPGKSYETSTGEVRILPLADGSTASINTKSIMNVNLTPKARLVNVVEGEVWFHVAKDVARPFVVAVGPVRVVAVGTAFSVRRRSQGTDVLVTQGIVETWVAGVEKRVVRVSAGTKAFVANDASISAKPAAANEINRALAWRDGMVELAGETLGEAAAEFNRYNTRKLVIADSVLAQERFYGRFRTDDPLGFAHAIHESLGALVIEDQPAFIRIVTSGA